jgi:hypothetical protein
MICSTKGNILIEGKVVVGAKIQIEDATVAVFIPEEGCWDMLVAGIEEHREGLTVGTVFKVDMLIEHVGGFASLVVEAFPVG